MHPFSILTLGIFVAGYITARWDLVTRLYELAIFAWDHGVVVCPGFVPGVRAVLTDRWLICARLERLKDSCSYPSSFSSLFFR